MVEALRHRRTLVSLACPVYVELLAGVTAGIINMVWVARLGGDAVARWRSRRTWRTCCSG